MLRMAALLLGLTFSTLRSLLLLRAGSVSAFDNAGTRRWCVPQQSRVSAGLRASGSAHFSSTVDG